MEVFRGTQQLEAEPGECRYWCYCYCEGGHYWGNDQEDDLVYEHMWWPTEV